MPVPELAVKVNREDLLSDFYLFCKAGLEMPVHDLPHEEMAAFISDNTQRQKLMLVPRDTWKTSICSTAFPLWMVLRAWFIDGNPHYRCLIDSETTRLSKFILKAIGAYVKNGRSLIRHFGELYRKELDAGEALDLSFNQGRSGGIREPNFLASGINSAKTGLHFDLIEFDDLVTERNWAAATQRDKTFNHYRLMYGIMESADEDEATTMNVIGTRWHDDDLYGRIIKADDQLVASGKPAKFARMIRACENEDGDLFFPDVLTKEVLAEKKHHMGSLFWAQFYNDPNKNNAPFKPEQLKFTSPDKFPDIFSRVRLSIDPAIKEDAIAHGDYTCMLVACWDRWGKPFVLDVEMRRDMTTGTFFDSLFSMAERWDVEQLVIEETSNAVFQDALFREMNDRKRYYGVIWVKGNRLVGKLTRWKRLQPFAERGGIGISDQIPEDMKVEIKDQWQRAPYATHDDFLDALELQLTYMPLDGSEVQTDSPQRSVADIEEGRIVVGPEVRTGEQVFPHLRAMRYAAKKDNEEQDIDASDDNQDEALVDRLFTVGRGLWH